MLPKVAANQRAVAMFLREVENTKLLNHPYIVRILDCNCSEGTFFLVLEYCHGGSVSDLIKLRGGKLSVEEAISITLQVLDGLDYAHNIEIANLKKPDGTLGVGKGIIHRDIKPDRIFLSPTGNVNDNNSDRKTIDRYLGKFKLAIAFGAGNNL
jgi:serine/threonine protein kinase